MSARGEIGPSARVYLDWNATTPPLGAVVEAMAEVAREAWGNPSSVHAAGRAARARVEGAREAVAALAGADPRDVVFTSGGTEANNLALRSPFADGRGGTLLTSRLEHPSVTRVAEELARTRPDVSVRWLAVCADGTIDLEDLERAARDLRGRALLALQALNHETGVVQPLGRAIDLFRARASGDESLVHVDAVQAFGKVADLPGLGADTRSLAAHKIRGPKGIGALVTRPGLKLSPVLLGGAQERGLRPGTLDPVAAAGFAVAAAHARTSPGRYAALAPLRDALERAIAQVAAGRTHINGSAARAPHVTNVSIDGWSGVELVAALDLEGVCVSSGAACSAGTVEASPVLTAMLGEARAASAVRISLGEETTPGEIDRALAALERVLARACG
jgi:cysteine desulfurase